METHRKLWNKQQKEFRHILPNSDQHQKAIELFLSQHAMLHSAKITDTGLWSFEDEILDHMSEEQFRRIPQNCEHSVAWVIWHMARIEDVAMNLLVADSPQVAHLGGWLKRMNISVRDTGNAMTKEAVADLSAGIDFEALRAYRLAVGLRTREIVQQLQPDDLKQQADPARLQRIMDEGALVDAASGIRDYWSKRTIAGLLLMPPTRHNFVHLNEALRLKKKRK